MKILLLADEESKYLWDFFEKEKLDGIDLIISCGDLKADPALPENVRNIRASLDRQIPPDVRERTLFYHLRGGIRYDRLSLRHRVMMGMLRQTLLRRPAASLTEEDRLLLETYGKEVDFTDLSALEPIAGVILSPKRL